MASNPPKNDDRFDLSGVVNMVSDHKKSVEELVQKVNKLEDKYGDNDKFVSLMCSSVDASVHIQERIAKVVTKLLDNDVDVKNAVIKILEKEDNRTSKQMWKTFGYVALMLFNSLVSGAVGVWLGNQNQPSQVVSSPPSSYPTVR